MTPEESFICEKCKHYLQGDNCIAFKKDGIPEEILSGENEHTEPLPKQDNDIVFEEKSNLKLHKDS